MLILGIETSCDETSAAVLDNQAILSNIIATQKIHEKYGGVVPEFASRAHLRQLPTIISAALREADKTLEQMEALAVTYGPGLAGSLLVGLCVCKSLAMSLQIPWIGINHIEGHILAAWDGQKEPEYPYVSMIASGGHTLLVLNREPLIYEIVGRTIDDAAGEAFDKVAKVLGLGYPGGPWIEKNAREGDASAIAFPRALMEANNLDFSFSGLKTAVLYHVRAMAPQDIPPAIPHITASFQKAVIDVLLEKSLRACQKFSCTTLVLAGGVVRNQALRQQFEARFQQEGLNFLAPPADLCTDNAAMIGRAGYLHLLNGERSSLTLDVQPNLCL